MATHLLSSPLSSLDSTRVTGRRHPSARPEATAATASSLLPSHHLIQHFYKWERGSFYANQPPQTTYNKTNFSQLNPELFMRHLFLIIKFNLVN